MFVTESSVRIIAGKPINKVNKQNLFYLLIINDNHWFFFLHQIGRKSNS